MTSTLLLIHLIFDKKFCQWSDFRSIVCARWLVNLKKNVLIFISFDPLYIVQQCQNIFIRSHHPENKTWVIDTYSTWASYQIWLSGSAKIHFIFLVQLASPNDIVLLLYTHIMTSLCIYLIHDYKFWIYYYHYIAG